MQTKITSYETLLMAAKQQTEPQRFLFVFLQASLPDDANDGEADSFNAGQGGALNPIMCVDKPLDELSDFDALVKESESMGQDWHIVLVAALSGDNGLMPTAVEADAPLKNMVQMVQNGGDLSKYMAFDKQGVITHFG
jgi:hypothetical protein